MYKTFAFRRKSLDFFRPDNLKVFALLTINALRDMYVNISRHALWGYYGVIAGALFVLKFLDLKPVAKTAVLKSLQAGFIFLFIFLAFVSICAARSSVDLKDRTYFFEKIKCFFFCYFDVYFASLIFVVLTARSVDPSFVAHALAERLTVGSFAAQLVINGLTIWGVLFGLFLIDLGSYRGTTYRAIGNALRMFWNNYPVFLSMALAGTAFHFVFLAVGRIISSISGMSLVASLVGFMIYCFVLLPLIIVIITNIYIKNVYEYNKTYFPAE